MTRKGMSLIGRFWSESAFLASCARQESWSDAAMHKVCAAQEELWRQYIPGDRYPTDGEHAAIDYLTRKVRPNAWDWLRWMLGRSHLAVFLREVVDALLAKPEPGDPEAY